jgi:hypothetical protein
MKHALSIAVSALIFAVVSGTAQAAPITSLPDWNRHHHYGYHSSYWNYYRVDWPGRGNNEESTR